MRFALIALVLSSTACGAGPDLVDCTNVGDVDGAVADVTERWPDVADIADRMRVFCVSNEEIHSVSRCGYGHAPTATIEMCTMWIGSSALYGGRMYVVNSDSDDVASAIRHEAQHWHLWSDIETRACASHHTSCGWTD